jgi:hypothetical protein
MEEALALLLVILFTLFPLRLSSACILHSHVVYKEERLRERYGKCCGIVAGGGGGIGTKK